uniref:DUF3778 domain-containing protein n=1 Tax=Oryza meridionalis TaxID=40149 RepID=A0A0E0EQS4_9ORYZ
MEQSFEGVVDVVLVADRGCTARGCVARGAFAACGAVVVHGRAAREAVAVDVGCVLAVRGRATWGAFVACGRPADGAAVVRGCAAFGAVAVRGCVRGCADRVASSARDCAACVACDFVTSAALLQWFFSSSPILGPLERQMCYRNHLTVLVLLVSSSSDSSLLLFQNSSIHAGATVRVDFLRFNGGLGGISLLSPVMLFAEPGDAYTKIYGSAVNH